jgi:hypothetical protein
MTRTMVALAAVAAIALSTTYLARVAQATQGDLHKVTICHRTNSVTNPYVQIDVDEAAVDGDSGNDNGQGDHLLKHLGPVWDANTTYPTPHDGDQWGDIIPPFYDDGVTLTGYASRNWNDAGKAIFDNGCNPAEQGSQGEPPNPEGSVAAGTGTPGNLPNTAPGDGGVNPLPTVGFSLILLGSLGALAYANVKAARG